MCASDLFYKKIIFEVYNFNRKTIPPSEKDDPREFEYIFVESKAQQKYHHNDIYDNIDVSEQ